MTKLRCLCDTILLVQFGAGNDNIKDFKIITMLEISYP